MKLFLFYGCLSIFSQANLGLIRPCANMVGLFFFIWFVSFLSSSARFVEEPLLFWKKRRHTIFILNETVMQRNYSGKRSNVVGHSNFQTFESFAAASGSAQFREKRAGLIRCVGVSRNIPNPAAKDANVWNLKSLPIFCILPALPAEKKHEESGKDFIDSKPFSAYLFPLHVLRTRFFDLGRFRRPRSFSIILKNVILRYYGKT